MNTALRSLTYFFSTTLQISVDGSPFDGSDEILRASRYCYGRVFADRPFYADAQPWVIPNEKAEHFIGVRFRFDSEIECKNVLLAFEEACEIDFNGKKADMTPCGTYVDHSIKTVRLPDIIKGENVLTVGPFRSRRDAVLRLCICSEISV